MGQINRTLVVFPLGTVVDGMVIPVQGRPRGVMTSQGTQRTHHCI
jgi:hypothetical protein